MKKLLLVASLFAGCTGSSSSTTASSSSSSSSGGASSSSSVTQSSSVPASSSSARPLRTAPVINEVSARGDDWVELANPSNAPLDIAGIALADQSPDGGPKMAEAVRFPSGTTIPVGGHLLVVADLNNAMPGVQTECLVDAGPPTCFQAAFGITAAGDRLYLLDESDRVLDEQAIPADIQTDGGSLCREPDITGALHACGTASPGAPNP